LILNKTKEKAYLNRKQTLVEKVSVRLEQIEKSAHIVHQSMGALS
jgi:hypothetical protein